jgi:hypothetical protein
VSKEVTEAEWAELVTEDDAFKLAIRGQTAIEGSIDAAIAEALVGDVPPELGPTTPFRTRLALAVGLMVIPPTFRDAFKEHARLRNDFAHGKIQELTPARAQELVASLRPLLGQVGPPLADVEAKLLDAPPIVVLRTTLTICRTIVQAARRTHEERRADEARILASFRSGAPYSRLVANLLADKPTEDTESGEMRS